MYRPADAVYRAIEDKDGVNPLIQYDCARQQLRFYFGTAMSGILDRNKDTAHTTFRFNGDKHFSEQDWQVSPRKIKGINPATEEFQDPPKGVPKDYPIDDYEKHARKSLENRKDPVYSKLYTARTIEVSAVDNRKDINEGV